MRSKERIPIVLKAFKNIVIRNEFITYIMGKDDNVVPIVLKWLKLEKVVEEFWLENPDLRLIQVLDTLNIVALDKSYFYNYVLADTNKEETNWLVEKGYCKKEDFNFIDNRSSKFTYYPFIKGDIVKKVTGYEFVGEVQGVITNSKEDVRYVVEDFLGRTESSGGTLHIFSGKQLEKETNLNDSLDRIIKKLNSLK